MTFSLAEIFRREPDLESFRRAVRSFAGDFPLGSAEMIELGEAYFERCPDRARERNAAEVLLGYALARVVLVEKSVLSVHPARRDSFRAMLDDVAAVGPSIDALLASGGRDEILADQAALRDALGALRSVIDEIPKGMIKERFVGGISNLFNIIYVIQMRLRGTLQ